LRGERTLVVDTDVATALNAFKVILQNEVDDAGDCVGAVNRRIAPGNYVNTFDQIVWNGIDVY